MKEFVALAIFLTFVNAGFLVILLIAYFLISRRRAKIYLLVDHLAALARKGLPLHLGLRALGQDLRGFLGTRLEGAARRMEEGASLGDAMAAAPRTFPPLLRSMVALGEKSGNFASFLDEMRRSYQRATEMTYQSVYPFLYPLVLTLCIYGALTGISVGVAPKFEEIFLQLGLKDPYSAWWPRIFAANQAVLILCTFMILFVVMGGFSPHFGSSFLRFLKRVTDRILLAVPFLGSVLREGSAHHFALCTGLFLRAGASLPEAVAAVAEVERNEVYRRRLRLAARRLAEGARLSDAVRPVFRSHLLWFVETGEAAGSLPEHLLEAAVHYETRVRFAVALAMRSLVPFFVVLNGGLTLATFLLIFLPTSEFLRSQVPP